MGFNYNFFFSPPRITQISLVNWARPYQARVTSTILAIHIDMTYKALVKKTYQVSKLDLWAIFSKNGAISEVTVSDFSLFPVYQWWLYKTQKCQIFFLDLQRFSRYWCCKTHFMAPTNLTSKMKIAIFFKIHNGFQRNFLERLGICQGRPGDKYLVPQFFYLF